MCVHVYYMNIETLIGPYFDDPSLSVGHQSMIMIFSQYFAGFKVTILW